MPKQVIRHQAGCALSEDVRSVLDRFFEEEEIRKLEVLGGTFEMTVSTRPRGIKKKPSQVIDHSYEKNLRRLAANKEDLARELISLNARQLRAVCEKLDLPTSSQLTNRQLISSIEGKLLSQYRWRHIVEHNRNSST